MRPEHRQEAPGRQRRLLLLALATIGAGLLGYGCAEQPTMILIRGAAVVGADCVAPTDPSVWQSQGVIDVSIASGYILAPNVENVSPPSEEVGTQTTGGGAGSKGAAFDNLMIEGNRVLITDVSVRFDSNFVELPGFDLPLGGFALDPSGGKATFAISVLNSAHVESMRNALPAGQQGLLMVSLRFSGITSSDTEVESNEFTFPISVCDGCLVATNCADSAATANRCALPGQDIVYCPATP